MISIILILLITFVIYYFMFFYTKKKDKAKAKVSRLAYNRYAHITLICDKYTKYCNYKLINTIIDWYGKNYWAESNICLDPNKKYYFYNGTYSTDNYRIFISNRQISDIELKESFSNSLSNAFLYVIENIQPSDMSKFIKLVNDLEKLHSIS